jgi:Peptidase propeptide and YPEB domain
MTQRYALAAVLLAALSVPAAAQQTTQPDTSKKTNPTGITTTTSPGAVEPTPAPTNPTAAPTTPTTAPTTPSPAAATPSVTTPPSTGVVSSQPAPAGAEGQIQPTSGAIKVDVKVDSSLAKTVKISADSAFALARASNTAGEISSAELEMTDNRLVYQVKMVKGTGASTVYVDAMSGEVVKDKKFGGVKAVVENAEESQKLNDAKKDSTEKKAP